MLTRERHALIAERLRSAGSVVASALAAELAVSEDTIRRDLRALEARGVCERVHGGALAPDAQPRPQPVRERTAMAGDEKARLAAVAARLAPADALVFLDAGSTNLAIAAALPQDRRLTVATNAPAIAALLYDRPGVSVILIGGRVDPLSGACVGADTVAAIARLRPALAYVGACALDAAHGLTAFSHEEAQVKEAIGRRRRGRGRRGYARQARDVRPLPGRAGRAHRALRHDAARRRVRRAGGSGRLDPRRDARREPRRRPGPVMIRARLAHVAYWTTDIEPLAAFWAEVFRRRDRSALRERPSAGLSARASSASAGGVSLAGPFIHAEVQLGGLPDRLCDPRVVTSHVGRGGVRLMSQGKPLPRVHDFSHDGVLSGSCRTNERAMLSEAESARVGTCRRKSR